MSLPDLVTLWCVTAETVVCHCWDCGVSLLGLWRVTAGTVVCHCRDCGVSLQHPELIPDLVTRGGTVVCHCRDCGV
jgi:hypothetical protein